MERRYRRTRGFSEKLFFRMGVVHPPLWGGDILRKSYHGFPAVIRGCLHLSLWDMVRLLLQRLFGGCLDVVDLRFQVLLGPAIHAVDEEDAVQVVILVLDGA